MSQHLPAHFVAAAESYLTGETEIEVQALSFSDIARIASGDAPLRFDAFQADEQGDLVPVIVRVDAFRGDRARLNTTFAVDKATGHLDRSAPVGARLTVLITEADDTGEERGHLFTTKAAEKAALFGDGEEAKTTRKSLWLPLDSDVLDEDSTGKVARKTLAGFHGSKVTASFVVEGVAPSVVTAKVREILAAEFGDAQGSVVSVEAEPVLDKRVDVYNMFTGAPIALNILVAEIDLLPEYSEFAGVDVRPAVDFSAAIGR